jgi:cysteine desulfurase / selenocysteine lyase
MTGHLRREAEIGATRPRPKPPLAWTPYLIDACQAVDQMPVDFAALGCDMLSATGREFLRGPGSYTSTASCSDSSNRRWSTISAHLGSPGCLSASRGRAPARDLGESSYAARLGLGVAVDYARALGIEAIQARCRSLATMLRHGLRRISGATVHDLGPHPAAIVSFSIAGVAADIVQARCAAAGVNVSTTKPSSTLLDAMARALPTMIRASPRYYGSEEEIMRALHVLRSAAP